MSTVLSEILGSAQFCCLCIQIEGMPLTSSGVATPPPAKRKHQKQQQKTEEGQIKRFESPRITGTAVWTPRI